jgi:hypothetical protein
MKHCHLRTTIVNRDSNEQVFRVRFSIFNKDVEISVTIEDTRVEQFVFVFLPRKASIGLN